MKRKIIFLAIFFMLVATSVFADTLTLKSGQTVEGTILERTEDAVKIDTYGVTLTYYLSDIDKINDERVVMAPEESPAPVVVQENEEAAMVSTETPETEEGKPTDISEMPEETQDSGEVVSVPARDKKIAEVESEAETEVKTEAESFSPMSLRDKDMAPNAQSMLAVRFAKNPKMLAAFAGFMFIMIIIAIAMFIYSALCLYIIAKKTNNEPVWLAWIPIANLFLMCKIATLSYLWLLGFLAAFIPIIGPLVAIALSVYFWYKIALARNKPGWAGILTIIPLAGLVAMGYIAFSD